MPGSQRVFVGNLAPDVRARDVEGFFRGYGKLGDISLKNGYGFVDFDDYRDAEDAVADLDGKDMNGDRIRVELAYTPREKERARREAERGDRGVDRRRARSPPRFAERRRGNPPGQRTNYRIIVENLSSRVSWQDLKDYFRKAGEITYTSAHKIRNGEGLVEFADRSGMRYAIDRLDNTELNGKRLKLVEEKRGGRGGRSRSRSPTSRSRSRSPKRAITRSRTRSGSRDRRGRS